MISPVPLDNERPRAFSKPRLVATLAIGSLLDLAGIVGSFWAGATFLPRCHAAGCTWADVANGFKALGVMLCLLTIGTVIIAVRALRRGDTARAIGIVLSIPGALVGLLVIVLVLQYLVPTSMVTPYG